MTNSFVKLQRGSNKNSQQTWVFTKKVRFPDNLLSENWVCLLLVIKLKDTAKLPTGRRKIYYTWWVRRTPGVFPKALSPGIAKLKFKAKDTSIVIKGLGCRQNPSSSWLKTEKVNMVVLFVVGQSLSCVRLIATLRIAVSQASLTSQSPRICSNSSPWVSDATQLSHLLPPSSAANISQHQGLFQGSSHQVSKVLKL